jgi:hypothetical protein
MLRSRTFFWDLLRSRCVCCIWDGCIFFFSSDFVIVSIALRACCGLFFRASSLCSVCHLGPVFCSLVLGFVFLRDMLRSRAFFETCLGLGFTFLLCFVLPCVILVFRVPSWSGFCSLVLGVCLSEIFWDLLRSRFYVLVVFRSSLCHPCVPCAILVRFLFARSWFLPFLETCLGLPITLELRYQASLRSFVDVL